MYRKRYAFYLIYISHQNEIIEKITKYVLNERLFSL